MPKLDAFTDKIGERIFQWRWLLMLCVAVFVFFFELDEHILGEVEEIRDFFREVLLFGLLFPLAGGIVLTILVRTRLSHSRNVYRLELSQILRKSLGAATGREELAATLIQYLRLITPISGAALLVHEPLTSQYTPFAAWTESGDEWQFMAQPFSRSTCTQRPFDVAVNTHQPLPCSCLCPDDIANRCPIYCLPLEHQNFPAAILFLQFPGNTLLREEQKNHLSEVGPEIALAIRHAQLQEDAINQEDTVAVEQRRIARNVHDTLGHNIAFLRFKLDQLSEDFSNFGMEGVQSDLQTMRSIANEAYQQMREVLVDLVPESDANMTETLLIYAQKASERANFQIFLRSNGQERPLPLAKKRQIYFIFKEALSNIEKHANASTVEIEVAWLKYALQIHIIDNGRGFTESSDHPPGHYGLTMMQDRAREVDGQVTINSIQSLGTQVSLWIPLVGN